MESRIATAVSEIQTIYSNDWNLAYTSLKQIFSSGMKAVNITNHFTELIEALRDYIISRNESFELKTLIPHNDFVEFINILVNQSLGIYAQFTVIRNIKDIKDQIALLTDIFYNAILRIDVDFCRSLEKYIRNPEEFINAYASLVYDCIYKRFALHSMVATINLNTGLDDTLSATIARFIDQNYLQLQMNYLILQSPR